MFSASSWALKRVYKFLLKRLLGKLLVNEIDLEQLEVQLGAGTLELRDLLLDTEYLNSQLSGAAVSLTAGYIGTIKATVPWKGLASQPIEIVIDELELTLAPQKSAVSGDEETVTNSNGQDSPLSEQEDSLDTDDPLRLQAYAGVDDGVKVIARLVENILLGLKVKVTNLVIRIEAQSSSLSDCALVLKVPFAEYKDVTPVTSVGADKGWGFLGGGLSWGSNSPSPEPTLEKTVSFKGVEAKLERTSKTGGNLHSKKPGLLLSGANGGADGSLRILMHWKSGSAEVPKTDFELLTRPLELHVAFEDVGRLSAFAACFQGSKPQTSPNQGFTAPGLVQKERTLHDLAASPGGFKVRKDDLLQSQYFSQKQVEELSKSSRDAEEWVTGLEEYTPGWLRDEEGGAEQEADLAASVDDFFDCLNGTTSGHLSRSSHSLGRRSVTWSLREDSSPPPLRDPQATSSSHNVQGRETESQASLLAGSRQTSSHGRALRKQASIESKSGLQSDTQPDRTAEYSARAKIAGLKVILLMPQEKDGQKSVMSLQTPEKEDEAQAATSDDAADERRLPIPERIEGPDRTLFSSGVVRGGGMELETRREEIAECREEGVTSILDAGPSNLWSGKKERNKARLNEKESKVSSNAVLPVSRQSLSTQQEGLSPSYASGGVFRVEGLGQSEEEDFQPEEDTFADALDFEVTDSLEQLQASGSGPLPAMQLEASGDVSSAQSDIVSSSEREEFGSANDVLKLEESHVMDKRTREESPCEIVEREWSPEPESPQPQEKLHAGEIALEMPLEDETSRMNLGAQSLMSGSVFGRESLFAWSGEGSEHWNTEEATENVPCSSFSAQSVERTSEQVSDAMKEEEGLQARRKSEESAQEGIRGGEGEEGDLGCTGPPDYVEVLCTGLSFSVSVSKGATSIELASDTLEIAEVLHSSDAQDSRGGYREQIHRDRQLQQVEAALPSLLGQSSPHFCRSPATSNPAPLDISATETNRRFVLLKVRSGPPVAKPAAAIKIVLGSGESTGQATQETSPHSNARGALTRQSSLLGHTEPPPAAEPTTEIKAELQPVTLFLDMGLPDRLKRFTLVSGGPSSPEPAVKPVPLLRASQVLPSPRRSFNGFLPPRPGSSPVDDIISDLDARFAKTGRRTEVAEKKGGPVSVTVTSSRFRVIFSCPGQNSPEKGEGVEKTCREDFLALDLLSVKSHGDEDAKLSFQSTPQEARVQDSFSADAMQEATGGTCVSLGAGHLALYLVTDSYPSEGEPHYSAFSLFSVSSRKQSESPDTKARQKRGVGASLEVRLNPKAEAGDWLTQLAWEGAAAQRTRGDGGSGVDNNQHGEAAAARASAADEDLGALEIRERAIASSATSVQLSFDQASIEVVRWRVERLGQLLEGVKGVTKPEEEPKESGIAKQTALLLNVAALDVRLLDVKTRAEGAKQESGSDKADAERWASFRADFSELTFFQITNLGGAAENSYMWIRHERCSFYGSLAAPPSELHANGGVELLLLTCSNEVLGRGDAGDENALASPGTVGLTISVISYPSGGFDTDSIVACSLRGGTVVAPGGRLDWVLAVKELLMGDSEGERQKASESNSSGAKNFQKHLDESFSGGSIWGQDETELNDFEENDDDSKKSAKGTSFLLDLHDLALCYEPTDTTTPPKTPSNPAPQTEARPPLSRQNSVNAPLLGSPVSAVLAVAALRVSSVLGKQNGGLERQEEEGGEQVFDIWLRDAALLILDNAMRRPAKDDFTTALLAQAGFVQVAREGVLEACIRTHTEEGLQWELDCTHNQLRLDTCHDTTAALGRLAGQIQALIQADMEPVTVAGGGAVIHRQSGADDPTVLLRTLSEEFSASSPPSPRSSLQGGSFRGGPSLSELHGRSEDLHGETDRDPEERGWDSGYRSQPQHAGQASGIPERRADSRTAERHTGADDSQIARNNFPGKSGSLLMKDSNPSSSRTAGLRGASGNLRSEKGEGRRPLPDFIDDFYKGRSPVREEGINTTPRSAIKQPIWTGDPAGVNTPRARPVTKVSTNVHKPSVSKRRVHVKEHDASWFDGKMPPLSEDYVMQPSTSPPKEDVGRPWLRNRGQGASKSRGSLPRKYPRPVGRLLLRDLSVRWRLYGGRDWGSEPQLRPASRREGSGKESLITRTVRASEDGLEGWSTVTVEAVGKAQGAEQTNRGPIPGAIQPPGRGGRQKENCLEVLLDGVDLQHDTFPQRDHYASRLAVSVRDITVYDFSKSAPWRMIMGHYRSASCPRESGSKALRVEMDSVRPDVTSLLEEYRLMLALLPLRLHLDQRHIDFCADFFAGGGPVTSDSPSETEGGANAQKKSEGVEEAFLPFFQMVEMRPLIIRVDYLPRRIDLLSLRNGNYVELLNLVTWEGVELRLKGVRAAGVHGWDGLGAVLMNDWVEDISQNQLNKIVRGVAPIRPLYEVGRAAAQLLVLPTEQYKKDKRLLKGLRKGAAAFLKGVSLEALGLGAQLAAGAHELLQQAEATLSGDAQSQSVEKSAPNGSPLQVAQPQGTREGLKQAFDSVSRGLERSASGVISAPIKRYQRSGSAGKAVATALRAAPAAVVAPAAATAGAVHRALLGVRNELDPERKREIDEKHAPPPPDGRRRS